MQGVPASGRTETETAVMRAWADVLSVEPESAYDDFFDLGGQSLQLVHFLQFVHARFGVDLQVAELFQVGFTATNTAAAIDREILERGALSSPVRHRGAVPGQQSQVMLAEAEWGRP